MARHSTKDRDASRLRCGLFAASLLVMLAGQAQAAWQLNLQEPATAVARRVYDLHSFLLWTITIIFIGVFAVVTYSLIFHRKSKGHKASDFHDNTTVEIVWTVVPTLILIGIAVPAPQPSCRCAIPRSPT